MQDKFEIFLIGKAFIFGLIGSLFIKAELISGNIALNILLKLFVGILVGLFAACWIRQVILPCSIWVGRKVDIVCEKLVQSKSLFYISILLGISLLAAPFVAFVYFVSQ